MSSVLGSLAACIKIVALGTSFGRRRKFTARTVPKSEPKPNLFLLHKILYFHHAFYFLVDGGGVVHAVVGHLGGM